MAKKVTSIYDNMTASDLARITRERGLEKPNVITLREWANWLEAQDQQKRQDEAEQTEVTGDDQDYDSMTVADLRSLAEQRGIELPERARKAEIIDILSTADKNDVVEGDNGDA